MRNNFRAPTFCLALVGKTVSVSKHAQVAAVVANGARRSLYRDAAHAAREVYKNVAESNFGSVGERG